MCIRDRYSVVGSYQKYINLLRYTNKWIKKQLRAKEYEMISLWSDHINTGHPKKLRLFLSIDDLIDSPVKYTVNPKRSIYASIKNAG